MERRKDALTWDEYFIGLAHLSAYRSKDPSTQVGAVIVDDDNRVVSIGYNGLPRGCSDDDYPWAREGEALETKYPFVVHAELNAILNSRHSVEGCTLYVSLFPCNECAKAIIQSGIKKIVYESDKYADTEGVKASKRMLADAKVKCVRLNETIKIEVTKTKVVD
ncbi:MAG: dCMP deaminase family protein [Bacillota bacterium]|jgi:dCMP deaminase|nr:dCMP deaminase family protein [Bacillota bacterium]NLP22741.1 dCMP deaminase family protein [Erysipelotrichaceae bacterium]